MRCRAEWMSGPNGRRGEPEDLVLETLDKVPARQEGEWRVTATLANAVRVLDLDTRWRDAIRWDEFRRTITVHGDEVSDEIVGEVGLWLAAVYGVALATVRIQEAVAIVAHRHEWHPVRSYLNGLTWDGVKRIGDVPSAFLGVEDAPLARELFMRFMVSAVARAMSPGCKVDTCLILVGPQGSRKSSALAELCGRAWFSDTPVTPGTKDALEQMAGVWFFEMAELSAVRRAEAQAVKAFISAPVDHYRPSYGRNTVTVPRQLVFVGSTNDEEFLSDPTGSRRFWPLRTGAIDLDGIRGCRDALWAEAVALWRAGEPWWLGEESGVALAEDSEQHQHSEVWADAILDYLVGKMEVTTCEILGKALDMDTSKMNRSDEMRIAAFMAKMGWKSSRRAIRGVRLRRWVNPCSA